MTDAARADHAPKKRRRSYSQWARDRLINDIAAAAALGHDVNELVMIRRGTSGTNHGTVARCSCGWQSTPRGKKVTAALCGHWHALEVVESLSQGLEPPAEWLPAPASPALYAHLRGLVSSDTP